MRRSENLGCPKGTAERALAGLLLLLCFLIVLPGCSRKGRSIDRPEASQGQLDRYVKKAIRSSSDGVILLPSRRAAGQFDHLLLRDISQGIRRPAAGCFLERAIHGMRKIEVEGRVDYENVPNGQAKIRVRIGPDGKVMRTELLESGFADPSMVQCLQKAISGFSFPLVRDGFAYFVDVIYWVSLGFFEGANDPDFQHLFRKEQARSGIRAKACLKGRASAGRYELEGLNLFDREGSSVANRMDHGGLSPEVSACVVQAFRELRIPPERDAFLRPVSPRVIFEVDESGKISVEDEEWLRVVELEEEAIREQKRRELLGEESVPVTNERPVVPEGIQDNSGSDSGNSDNNNTNATELESEVAPSKSEKTESDSPATPPPGSGQSLKLELRPRSEAETASETL